MEFKGTKGKWNWSYPGGDELGILMSDIGVEVMNFGDTTTYYPTAGVEPNNYDAQLIAHAPDMYDEIKESITDLLCIQSNVLDSLKTDNRWEGVYEILQKQIDRKKDLLTRATTI